MRAWLRKLFGRGIEAEAAAAYEAGDWARAATLLQRLTSGRPDDAKSQYRLGDALYQLDRVQEALAPLERAARIAPDVAEHHYKLGNALKDLERLDEAHSCYRRAIEIEPHHARALNNAGVVLETLGRLEDAVHCYRRATQADRTMLPAHSNLATLLHRMGRRTESAEAYRDLLRFEPDAPEPWCELGDTCQRLEQYEDAVRCYERALAIDPAFHEAHYKLSLALLNLGKYAEAEAPARRAVEAAPGLAGRWANLGDVLQWRCRFDEALAAYHRALDIDPTAPEVLNNLGTTHKRKRSLESACRFFERATEVAPDFAPAHLNLAATRLSLGLCREAIAGFRRIADSEPRDAHASRQLLMALLYDPDPAVDPFGEQLAIARRFDPTVPAAAPRRAAAARTGGRLRIGYLSSDFRRHPVGYNMTPIIRWHDRGKFEIYLYSDCRQPDDATRWFQGQATAWRSTGHLSDDAVTQLIEGDRLDILVYLAGRFDENRLHLAARRLAPVQASMHDPATSGLREMDYLVADRALSPRHTPEKFTERVACLPTFYVHDPMNDVQALPEPPSAKNDVITFGSFNNPAKVNEGVVALWARVLRAVSGSRLLLKYMGVFAIPSVRSRYAGLFREHGIEEERLVMPEQPREEREGHLAHYQDMDIALDTFPFSGSTTTFEALWMGVPVVTLQGERMVGRWSAAMLRKVGLARLIAETEAEFVAIARTLAADRAELARLRTALRERVARSPLCAGEARARQLERLYRRMWARWLSQQS